MRSPVRWSVCLGLGLALLSVTACSEGAPASGFPSFPPSPSPGGDDRGTSDDAVTGNDSSDPGECCVANGTPGCNESSVEACVCAEVSTCCDDAWTASCAALVDELGCGQCTGPLDTGADVDPDDSGGGSTQDCCAGGPQPGCNDPVVEACVCSEVAFCCDTGWEKVCASAVEALGCGHCGGVGDTGEDPPPPGGDTGGDPPPPPAVGGCCEVGMGPGCDDPAVESCVCMQDAYCCDTQWDDVCIDEVDSLGCGSCGGAPPVSPCCQAQAGPGCGDPPISDCVCLFDDYCCTVQWDDACAVFVELFACGTCS